MPNYFLRDGNGQEIPIKLEACSRTIRHFYHGIRISDGQLLTFHRNALVIKFTPEEILEQQRREMKAAMHEIAMKEQELAKLDK